MHPRDFVVNRTWLAFRINQLPVSNEDGEFDIFVLQDAGSMFLFGNAFAPHGEYPSREAVVLLLEQAWSHHQEWPEELVLPGKPSSQNSFASVAREHGISVRAVAEARMAFYITDVQSAFEEHAQRNSEGG
jgi:hypothetical protein